jgi:hypothetical protein
VKFGCISVGEFHNARSDCTWKPARVRREVALTVDYFLSFLVHEGHAP